MPRRSAAFFSSGVAVVTINIITRGVQNRAPLLLVWQRWI